MKLRPDTFALRACALAACTAFGPAMAQQASWRGIDVPARRLHPPMVGATGLPMDAADTPQSLGVVDAEDLRTRGITESNAAVRLATGIDVEQYDTNRALFYSRGFQVGITQIDGLPRLDGLGRSNGLETVVGQIDTAVLDRIEVVRGANSLLTGMGTPSGTLNYVRKRPLNEDGGEISLTTGSHAQRRVVADYNKVFTEDASWAGRLVVAHEDKGSYLRDLHDRRSTLYGVVDGRVGRDGMLTLGLSYQQARQDSPMLDTLILNRLDGTQADLPASASTSQKWTYWDTRSQSVFAEYTHVLGRNWEASASYSHGRDEGDNRLFFAFAPLRALNKDNTGLIGWPYGSQVRNDTDALDTHVTGQFQALGRQHSMVAGISHWRQSTHTDTLPYDKRFQYLPLPALPYAGTVYPEPAWGSPTPNASDERRLTRLYGATRVSLSDDLHLVAGLNVLRFDQDSWAADRSPVKRVVYPTLQKASPYLGLTYAVTPDVMAYASYADIYQPQTWDKVDARGSYLGAVRGVNLEAGVKADWLDRQLQTTFAVFSARQKGLATLAGTDARHLAFYVPKDVSSRGVELEATGRVGADGQVSLGVTRLQLDGPDGKDMAEWVPRTAVNFLYDTAVPALPGLRVGAGGHWQSAVHKVGGAHQGSYLLADAFVSYAVTDRATVRLNIHNLFDKKYIQGVAYNATYGAPRRAELSLDYKF